MINTSRTALSDQIHHKIVDPARRGMTSPDSGEAFLSSHFSRLVTGASYNLGDLFWEYLSDPGEIMGQVGITIANSLESVFGNILGLQNNDIFVDVLIRTPYGNQWVFNLPLHTDAITTGKKNDILQGLQNGKSINVKIIYDGGKPSECTPVSYKFNAPTPEHVVAELNKIGYNSSLLTPSPDPTAGSAPSITGALGTSDIGGILGASNLGAIPNGNSPIGLTSSNSGGAFDCYPNQGSAGPGCPGPYPYRSIINSGAKAFGVSPKLVAAIMTVESHGFYKAIGHDRLPEDRGLGLMQIIPNTLYNEVLPGVQAKFPKISTDWRDPVMNIFCGCWYINNLNGYGYGQTWTIQAYNAGPGKDGHKYNPIFDPVYLNAVTPWLNAYQASSEALGGTKLQRRAEVSNPEVSNYGKQTANVAIGAGGAAA